MVETHSLGYMLDIVAKHVPLETYDLCVCLFTVVNVGVGCCLLISTPIDFGQFVSHHFAISPGHQRFRSRRVPGRSRRRETAAPPAPAAAAGWGSLPQRWGGCGGRALRRWGIHGGSMADGHGVWKKWMICIDIEWLILDILVDCESSWNHHEFVPMKLDVGPICRRANEL